jgi:hypothetical protein
MPADTELLKYINTANPGETTPKKQRGQGFTAGRDQTETPSSSVVKK